MPTSILVTGAGGYVGRRLVRALAAAADARVTALVHRAGAGGFDSSVRVACADVTDHDALGRALSGQDVVVHLAAVTGKARRSEYFRVNTDGTATLVAAAASAGVGSIVFVSSIAARFADLTRYRYGQSKREAEGIVRSSGLPCTIVRPTMIVGHGAPVLAGLAKLACAPFVPVFGDGTARVQPVAVGDVVSALSDLARAVTALAGEEIDLGGPDVVTIEELLMRLRRLMGGKGSRVVHLPAQPAAWALGLLERPLLALLPLTAGQLATFTNDGVAAEHPYMSGRRRTPLDVALAEFTSG